jgi:Lrp/AsnC family leucine-responsive transcriptional regulator
MESIDRKIIEMLATDARRSLADIGAEVGLSTSAVNERVKRLVSSGAIRNFTVNLDPDAYGAPVLAFVFVALAADADETAFRQFIATQAMVLECHHVTGGWSYLMKVRVGSLPDLEAFLTGLKDGRFIARSETIIALSSAVAGTFTPPIEAR